MMNMSSDHKFRILIIDDNPDIHRDFKTILAFKKTDDAFLDAMDEKLFGAVRHEESESLPQFEIDSAMQGEVGCELVRESLQQNKPYALAFVDIRIPPGIDGVETIKRILAIDQQIQLVICTAYSDYSFAKIMEKIGRPEKILILKKPFDCAEVRQLAIALTKKWQLSQAILSPVQTETVVSSQQQELLVRSPTKLFFNYLIAEAIHYAEHNMFLFAILRLNIDNLAVVHDTYGQNIQNELLSQFVDRLSKQLRTHDALVQLRDDQFGILLTNFNVCYDVQKAAERILNALKEPFFVQAHQVSVLNSIGVSFFPIDARLPEELVNQAECAMRGATALGNNQYQFHSLALMQNHKTASKVETEIHQAIKNNEFFLLYQPQYDLTENKIQALEVFLRWNHPTRGVLTPIDFIVLSENVEIFVVLGFWVVAAVCRQIAAWKQRGFNIPTIAINLTPHQFQHPDLVKKIADIFQETGVDPQCVEFEIMDNIFEMYADAKNKIAHLKALGVSMVLDNFGTAYSSVSAFRDHYFSKLKIDQSFTHNIHQSEADEIIIHGIIEMASAIGVRVVALNVENQQQLTFLKENGCHMGQGFYLDEPLTVVELEKRFLPS